MTEMHERAAVARRSTYRARADRPMQRRSDVSHGGRAAATYGADMQVSRTGFDFGNPQGGQPSQVPAGSYWIGDGDGDAVSDLYFTGLASSTNSPYEMYDAAGPYQEIVAPGAFQASLALGDQLDVPLVIQHTDIRRIARTTIPVGMPGHLQLSESSAGLVCLAQLDPADPDVQYVIGKIQSGLVSEMSFRFEITSGEWSPDYSQFVINSASLQRGDVSICGYGANPNTFAAMSRSAQPMSDDAARKLYDQLRSRFEAPAPKPTAPRSFLVRDEDLR